MNESAIFILTGVVLLGCIGALLWEQRGELARALIGRAVLWRTMHAAQEGAPAALGPAAEERPLHQGEPLVQQYRSLLEQLEHTRAALSDIPTDILDHVELHAELAAVELQLAELAPQLRSLKEPLQPALATHMGRLARRLTSLQISSDTIATDMAAYATLRRRLRQQATQLLQEINSPDISPARIVWSRTGPITDAALGSITRLPSQPASWSHDDLRREIGRLRGLLSDLEAIRGARTTIATQREILLVLLEGPELSEPALWYQAISQLSRRIAYEPGISEPDRLMRDLVDTAEHLFRRRQALMAQLAAPGGRTLDEAALPAFVREAISLHDNVRALWNRARVVTSQRKRPPSEELAGNKPSTR